MRSKSRRSFHYAPKVLSASKARTSLIQAEFATNYARAQRQNPIWAQVVTKWFCGGEHGACMQRQKSENQPRAAPCRVNLQHARNIGSIHAAPLIAYVREPTPAAYRGKNFDSMRRSRRRERESKSHCSNSRLAEIKTEAASVCLQLISGP